MNPAHAPVHEKNWGPWEYWQCDSCSRRVKVQWLPKFDLKVLVEGDGKILHCGAKGEMQLGVVEIVEEREH